MLSTNLMFSRMSLARDSLSGYFKPLFPWYEFLLFVHMLDADDRQVLFSEQCYGRVDVPDSIVEGLRHCWADFKEFPLDIDNQQCWPHVSLLICQDIYRYLSVDTTRAEGPVGCSEGLARRPLHSSWLGPDHRPWLLLPPGQGSGPPDGNGQDNCYDSKDEIVHLGLLGQSKQFPEGVADKVKEDGR